jgi:hypothetical protein
MSTPIDTIREQPTGWKAEIRYPNGDIVTRYASTEDAVRQLALEAYAQIPACTVTFRPLYAAPVTPKRLTDAEIERINSDFLYRNGKFMTPSQALRYARDQGYIGGLSVERVMEVVRHHNFRDQHPAESADTYLEEMYADLEQRLAKALNEHGA